MADFLDVEGKPLVIYALNDDSKLQKRVRSLRAFKLQLGAGLVEDASGKSQKWVPSGSNLCHMSLWQWTLTRIERALSARDNQLLSKT